MRMVYRYKTKPVSRWDWWLSTDDVERVFSVCPGEWFEKQAIVKEQTYWMLRLKPEYETEAQFRFGVGFEEFQLSDEEGRHPKAW